MQNKSELERLYTDQRGSLLRFISRKMRQAEEAEDVVQETFIRLVNDEGKAAKGLAGADSPVAYLYRIASNLAIDRLRQQKSRCDEGNRGVLDETQVSVQPEVSQQAASQERLQQLQQAVGRLPLKRRQVFVLHKFRQMTYREVATHLDISVSMVEKHMMKALAQLQDTLEST
ncbi:MAG: RNA polymerase sigma factor [Halioglobus sp.]